MRSYLVTGCAGFIGAKVCEQLLAEGHAVVGIDNLNAYYDPRLKLYRLGRLLGRVGEDPGKVGGELDALGKELGALGEGRGPGSQDLSEPLQSPGNSPGSRSGHSDDLSRPKGGGPGLAQSSGLRANRSLLADFTFYSADIEDLSLMERLFFAHRFDGIFNLAARAGIRYSLENPHVYLRTNAVGTLNLLECQRRFGVRKQVLASSSSVYSGSPLPFTEDQPVNTPCSPYAASKKAAEMFAYTYSRQHGLDVTVLRFFTVFGPAGRPDMAPYRFIKWIAEGTPVTLYGDGSQTRDFTYIDDIVGGTIAALRPAGSDPGLKASPAFDIINLGGGNRPVSLKTVIGWIEQAVGRKAEIRFEPPQSVDMAETGADIRKAGQKLGWKPQVSPQEGFRRAAEWYRLNAAWLKDVSV